MVPALERAENGTAVIQQSFGPHIPSNADVGAFGEILERHVEPVRPRGPLRIETSDLFMSSVDDAFFSAASCLVVIACTIPRDASTTLRIKGSLMRSGQPPFRRSSTSRFSVAVLDPLERARAKLAAVKAIVLVAVWMKAAARPQACSCLVSSALVSI
jgi:hypothetical protein